MCHSSHRSPRTAGRPYERPSGPAPRDPDLRASDAEREEVVSRLREHGAAGRLDVEELEERVAAAYAARTHRDFGGLETDLPRLRDSMGAAHTAPAGRRWHGHGSLHRTPGHEVRAFLLVSLTLVAVWTLLGAGYFWPAWAMLWWGAALAIKLPLLRARGRGRMGARSY